MERSSERNSIFSIYTKSQAVAVHNQSPLQYRLYVARMLKIKTMPNLDSRYSLCQWPSILSIYNHILPRQTTHIACSFSFEHTFAGCKTIIQLLH